MSGQSTAIVTASYAPDFARCALLCETIDRYVTGYTKHYILVDTADAKLFAQLASPRRVIITDKTLLPWWMIRISGKIAPKGKTMWLSPRTVPMHGWHMQQIRRIAIAHHVDEDALFYCDSDTVFTKAFDMSLLWKGDQLRLFREDHSVDASLKEHQIWIEHAATAFGDKSIKANRNNYVRTFIAWRRDTVLAMCKQLETAQRSSWIAAIGQSRKFSECTLYGAFADKFGHGDKHWIDDRDFCKVHWFNPPPSEQELVSFVNSMTEQEYGFGVQSFVPVDIELVRALSLGNEAD